MIKKINILVAIFAAVITSVFPQTVELDFPKLGGDTAWVYFFTGSRMDSLAAPSPQPPPAPPKEGNASAQGSVWEVVGLPQGYRGLAYLYIPGRGVGEFILAEERVRISCAEERFNAMMLAFPGSEENDFMRWSFQWQNFLASQKAEMDKGEASYGLEMAKLNEKATHYLNDLIAASSLYAARLMEWMGFMQRMYAAVQAADTAQQRILKNEMEHTLDIGALYHAGNLWIDIHSWYPGLFIGADGKPVEEDYAASVGRTLRRLEEPVLTAFLSEALVVCERQNLQKAQELMLTDFIMTYPTLPVGDPKVQRMLGALSLNKGAQAPTVAGLKTPLTQAAIIIFFDSECDHCRDEIDWLSEHYKELTEQGYRVISIAADVRENKYSNYAAAMPWNQEDRLCDFKGTEGANFKNYGVIGTPTIFAIDNNNIITGKYAKAKEILKDQNLINR